jgi:regulation of enolase protein 1 (concanavalin A-like superfamily)
MNSALEFEIPLVPLRFRWDVFPAAPPHVDEGSLGFSSPARTDLFADPSGPAPVLDAPRALSPVTGDFQLVARVTAELRELFDAGALLLWCAAERWAKLALERSPERKPTIVSVVTRGTSDDCNSCALEHPASWLRISRLGAACAFHVSDDGTTWRLIRHFAIAGWEPLSAGFLVQSPRGRGTAAAFSEVRFLPVALEDLRSGA